LSLLLLPLINTNVNFKNIQISDLTRLKTQQKYSTNLVLKREIGN